MKKDRLIKNIITYARTFHQNLENKNIVFIFENTKTKDIEFVETVYHPFNLLHLIGGKMHQMERYLKQM